MNRKFVEVVKKIGNVFWNFPKFVAIKFWSLLKLIGRGIKKLIKKIKNRKKPSILVLVKRIFHGFLFGFFYGIRDAKNSWKYDRGKITDYEIEIQSLSFHDRG